MRRRAIMFLLALGTLGGYAAGFHSLHAHAHHFCHHHEARFEPGP
jgi:hypothetical protein